MLFLLYTIWTEVLQHTGWIRHPPSWRVLRASHNECHSPSLLLCIMGAHEWLTSDWPQINQTRSTGSWMGGCALANMGLEKIQIWHKWKDECQMQWKKRAIVGFKTSSDSCSAGHDIMSWMNSWGFVMTQHGVNPRNMAFFNMLHQVLGLCCIFRS